jgi:hypothetical protein
MKTASSQKSRFEINEENLKKIFLVDGKSNEDSFNFVVENHSKVQRLVFGGEILQKFKNDSSRQFRAFFKRFENRRLITQLPQNSLKGKLISSPFF